ncbi:SufD family Fe-S cluster assembly protein [Vulcanisaeta sp. JCM 14467]
MGKWLDELRLRARELAQKIPYQQIRDSPSVKYYTDWTVFDHCADPSPEDLTKPQPLEIPYELNVASINGSVSITKVPSGVTAMNINEFGEEFGKLLFKSIDISESKALARHVANLVTGVYVEVNDVLREPLRIGVASSLSRQVLLPTHYTVLINDGVNASLSIFMLGAGGCPSTTVEIYLGRNSRLNLLITGVHEQVPAYTLIKVIAADESSVTARTLIMGGSMNHHREDYLMQGVRSSLNHLGLEVGYGTSRIDYQVNAIHTGEYGTSYSRVLGIARDKSFIIHRALGRIIETARWSDTSVEGKVFVMNEGAHAASVPIIMVDTGDVNGARHSAADASPDEDQVNYLRLRGISKDEVTDLIIHEVVSQFIDSLPSEFTRDAEVIRSLAMSKVLVK